MAKEIKIYSTPICPACREAKKFLNKNKIKFSDINVAEDVDAAQEMVKKTGQYTVPVIIITDEKEKEKILVGFDEKELKEALGI